MGNGSSMDASRVIYVDIGGKEEKIVFSRSCGTRDIIDLLTQAGGVTKFAQVTLKDRDGALVAISPSMPPNTPATSYKATFKEDKRRKEEAAPVAPPQPQPQVATVNNIKKETEMLQNILTQVAEQFNKSLTSAFKMEESQNTLIARLNDLERKIETEGLKVVEIEKCKKDIRDLKNQLYDAHKKMVDYNKLSSLVEERKICLRRDVPSYPKYTLSDETINYLKQPTFDIWHWEPNEMLSLLEHMYHELGLVQEFNINPITLKRWLLCVQENYRNNPFHNFRHCFCVTQMMYGMIQLCCLWENMSREDLGILITSCVCHDLDHPGYNNTYQINARTELAIRYNDISPLENHHCAVAFQILSNPETNIFGNVDAATFKRIRSGIIMLVLATDMARHSEILEAFKSKIEKGFDFTNDDHLNSLKMVLIKCCDISNEVRPFEVSEPWVDCLLEEYFNQSDREKEEGLPVAPFMDREKVTKPTAQIGFIKFVLIPMFETVSALFPQLEDVMCKPLKDARDRYEELKESFNEKKKEAEKQKSIDNSK